MKQYFAYLRVSTLRQGEHGSSLQEQRDAIMNFAVRHGFAISEWFEERETASKVGRPEFARMLARLRKGAATGVVFHKIDRSARNLRDWSAIQDLADLGVIVRFTQESIDLASNEGKLTGDFLAAISAHYSRNLRDEVRKGIRGRLKQGFYPFRAPVGYLDQGAAKAKTPDPVKAPLIRAAFDLYAGGTLSLHRLSEEMHRRGLRSRTNRQLGPNRLSDILRNPFYIGIIRMKRSGESYSGVHEPLISKSTFDQVQSLLDGKAVAQIENHDFLFCRLIRCAQCGYSLVGERQKGRVYYRCHTKTCPTKCIREDAVDQAVRESLLPIALTDTEFEELKEMASSITGEWTHAHEDRVRIVRLQIENAEGRMSRLVDAYLDGAVERTLFEEKKLALLLEKKGLEERRDELAANQSDAGKELDEFLELAQTMPLGYGIGNPSEKREILKTVTSNLLADRKDVVFELLSPFRELANLPSGTTGGPLRYRPRTERVEAVLKIVMQHCERRARNDEPAFPLAA